MVLSFCRLFLSPQCLHDYLTGFAWLSYYPSICLRLTISQGLLDCLSVRLSFGSHISQGLLDCLTVHLSVFAWLYHRVCLTVLLSVYLSSPDYLTGSTWLSHCPSIYTYTWLSCCFTISHCLWDRMNLFSFIRSQTHFRLWEGEIRQYSLKERDNLCEFVWIYNFFFGGKVVLYILFSFKIKKMLLFFSLQVVMYFFLSFFSFWSSLSWNRSHGLSQCRAFV